MELEIIALEGKFKLSQNRDPADRQGVLEALEANPYDASQALLKWMRLE